MPPNLVNNIMEHIDNIKKKHLNEHFPSESEIRSEPKAPFIWKSKKNILNDQRRREEINYWYEMIMQRDIYSKYIEWYTLTLSPKDPTVEIREYFYDLALLRLQSKCKTIIDIVYILETSKHGKLHVHGIIATRDKTKFLKIKRDIRFNWHMDPLTYLDGWINYMLKESPKHVYTGV